MRSMWYSTCVLPVHHLCAASTSLVCCLYLRHDLSQVCLYLAGAVLPRISPIAGHNTTGFVNHIQAIVYQGTNMYLQLRKFWCLWPTLVHVQMCSLVQDCWHMVHNTCWVVRCNGCVAVCCSVLQCVAVCCSVLQCVAVCCSVLQCVCRVAQVSW